MHELGIMTGVVETVEQAARDAGAEKVLKVNLAVGAAGSGHGPAEERLQ